MKYAYLLAFALIFSCKDNAKTTKIELKPATQLETETYASFGAKITDKNTTSADKLLGIFKDTKTNDTLVTKAKVKVLDVCQAKGCWMVVDLGNEQTARVKFKDYGFFMPKDIKGKEVIINGKAFVNVMPVEELQHYAEDAGKSKEEIAKITEPKRTNSFLADGVLLVN